MADFLYVGQKAQLVFNNSDFPKIYGTSFEPGNRGREQEFSATVLRITPPLSAPATVRTIKWSIDNSAGLLEPQTYGGVNIRLRERRACLTLPLSAMTDNSRTAVFIVKTMGRWKSARCGRVWTMGNMWKSSRASLPERPR